MNYKVILSIVLVAVVISGLFVVSQKNTTLGGTPGIVPATVATSSFQAVVAGSSELLFATSTSCATRIITTRATAVTLTFSDLTGQRPTGVSGHQQTASTTVAYPAEDFGCGAVWVFPYGTDTLTVTETR